MSSDALRILLHVSDEFSHPLQIGAGVNVPIHSRHQVLLELLYMRSPGGYIGLKQRMILQVPEQVTLLTSRTESWKTPELSSLDRLTEIVVEGGLDREEVTLQVVDQAASFICKLVKMFTALKYIRRFLVLVSRLRTHCTIFISL